MNGVAQKRAINLKPAIVLGKKKPLWHFQDYYFYYTSLFCYVTRHLNPASFWALIMACDKGLHTHFCGVWGFFQMEVYIQWELSTLIYNLAIYVRSISLNSLYVKEVM